MTGRIDEACDRFERAWRSGPRIQIEDILAQTPPDGRAACWASCWRSNWTAAAGRRVAAAGRVSAAVSRVEPTRSSRLPPRGETPPAWATTSFRRSLVAAAWASSTKARQVHLNQIVAIKVLPERYLGRATGRSPLQAGDAVDRRAGPSEHRSGLQRGRGRWRPFPGHGVRRRHRPAAADREAERQDGQTIERRSRLRGRSARRPWGCSTPTSTSSSTAISSPPT